MHFHLNDDTPTLVPTYKVNDPSKVLAIGLTETYSHMAPWHVIMGQSFGASITYQLDAGKFVNLYRAIYRVFLSSRI